MIFWRMLVTKHVSAVKRLIAFKKVFVYIIVYGVYYVYTQIHTHACIYLRYMFILNIFINYMNIHMHVNIFKIYTCIGVYLYIHNIHSTHRLCKQKLLFWMRLIAINRLTALKHLTVAFDFHSMGRKKNQLFKTFFCVQQKKETHTGGKKRNAIKLSKWLAYIYFLKIKFVPD